MYRQAFPRCTVIGSVKPVPFKGLIKASIPEKCDRCANMFEGGCVRAAPIQHYMALDHGPCPIKGPTHPIICESDFFKGKVTIPAKCNTCQYLHIDRMRGFFCDFEREIWGDLPRSLDWGNMETESAIPAPKSRNTVLFEMMQAVSTGEIQAIKIFQQAYPDATLNEARDAYAEVLARLKHISSKH